MKKFLGRLLHLWLYGFALAFMGSLGVVALLIGHPMEWVWLFDHPGNPYREEEEMKASLRSAFIVATLFWLILLAAYPPAKFGWMYALGVLAAGVMSWYFIERRYVDVYRYTRRKDG